ncbi:MAG: hypothetical protein AUK60_01745 [Rhodobacteraceae bacterium CG2_30_10_405]|nr:MAG: hypothetical protein AUK60_01745 [Rhodobacteraceae bacterium CG2_30_10_405]
MRATNRLTAAYLRAAPVGKHCDGAGLWLIKRDGGGAQWVLRATVHGRRRGAKLWQIAEILPKAQGRRDEQAAGKVLKQAERLQFDF